MRAMILAAGRGERMRPLTDTVPKPLLEAGGEPLLGWHLRSLARAGFQRVVINHAYLGQMIEDWAGSGVRWGLKIDYSREGPALETAGGIRQALDLLGDEPFLVVNADVFADWPFERARTIAAQMKSGGLSAWCVLVDNPKHHPSGDFAIEDGWLRNHGRRMLTFSGIGVYHPGLFVSLPEGVPARLAPLLREQAQARLAAGEYWAGTWTDVGSPARLAELNAEL
ncbi:MAG: N-acetylmuramate alpha-1-phosphate uridylyltransferase MurU, partial [Betaproteobacteria bacterium]